jgi:hypothetical protein
MVLSSLTWVAGVHYTELYEQRRNTDNKQTLVVAYDNDYASRMMF